LIFGPLAEQCSKISLDAWKALGCRDAGRIDVKLDENGIPNFIEVNPLAGINYHYSDLPILMNLKGESYNQLIASIIESASERIDG
jgi:D-alanine-D-alanine ligase